MTPLTRNRFRRSLSTCAVLMLALGVWPNASGQDAPTLATDALRTAGQIVRSITPQPSDAVVLRNRTGVVIQGKHIDDDVSITLENCQDITIISCDVRSIHASGVTKLRIYNSFIHDSTNNAVNLDDCHDAVVQGNRIEKVATGVYAHKSTAVQVIGNLCLDVQGPMPRGQLAQFDKVTGPGNLIMGNVAVNHHGQSNPEDMINLFQSIGTAESPIRIELNILSGDPEVGSQDLSDSGSGIMLGDGGGRFQLCANNTLINTGQVGIGVAGGGDIQVLSNIVVGQQSNIANVGLYTWNQYKDAPTGDITVAHNRVQWVNADGQPNHYWNGQGFTQVTQQNNTFGDPSLTADRLPTPDTQTRPPLPHGQTAEYPFALY